MNFLHDKIRIALDNLYSQSRVLVEHLNNIECVKVNYKSSNNPPKDGWEGFTVGTQFSGIDEHYWFRTKLKTPCSDNKEYVLKVTTGREKEWDATAQQCIIYLNGKMVQGCDTNHTEVYLNPDTEYEVYNYYYTGMTGNSASLYMSVYEVDVRIEQLYYDIKVAFDTAKLMDERSDEYKAIMPHLLATANLIDMRSIYSEEYFKSIKAATDYINEEFYNKVCSVDGKPIVNCIGHTHIDVEWMWTRSQTREKIQRSFSTANELMKRYPEYKFMLSQPELYRYLKEEAPEKYEELKQLVKDERWEPEGAMWVEADCNLISGESFIRQMMHGKKFFKDEFGKDNKVLFLPDVFGYSAAMPQILKKCGLDYFITSKISWSDTNTMPVDEFMWQGIDGTEILTNFITTQTYTGLETKNLTTYVGMLTPAHIKGTWNRFKQKEYANMSLTTFGYGDGGGGPTKEMLETYRRLRKGLPGMPVVKMEFLLPYLKEMEQNFKDGCEKTGIIPKWVGELYLEFHRGTYTSIAKNKKNNRKSEFALQKAEALSVIDSLSGGEYDAQGLYYNWRRVLHNQFHDILPGSSIKEVYDGTDKDYAEIGEYTSGVINSKIKSITGNIKTDGGVFVYNPSGFERSVTATLDGRTVESIDKIKPFGWGVTNNIADCSVSLNGLTAENKYYVLTLNEDGKIVSLFDKRNNREVFKKGELANELRVFEDYPHDCDAWEINEHYFMKMWTIDKVREIKPVYDGSRAGFRITRDYLSSTIEQTVWLYSENERIDLDYKLDWHERHQLLKIRFPLDVNTSSATSEIQFGHVTRSTHKNTSWDEAKFEVYAHKWLDVAEAGYGVAFLNDSKYGYSIDGTDLSLTALKCATDPNPEADQGEHIFTYSILPHSDDFRKAGVINAAYELNQPMIAAQLSKQDGKLSNSFSFISADKDNVIIETVKNAEAQDGVIVRLYDAHNMRSDVTLTLCDKYSEAYVCDMLENEQEKIPVIDNKIKLTVKPFEIVTLKLKGRC